MSKKIGLTLLVLVTPVILLLGYVAVRHIVFWAPTEAVTFDSAGVRMAGTFIKPSTDGVFPAVIMLHGSGPEKLSDPAVRTTANALVRAGFAVLIYDKRGVGASGGDFARARFEDFINDAIAAVEFVASRGDVDTAQIGLYGVSESGWFTPEIALRTGKIAFVFNKVGPPVSWYDTVRWETRNDYLADGIAETDVDRLVEFAVRRWDYYIATAADPALSEGPERDALAFELARLRIDVANAADVLPEELWPYDKSAYEAFAADATYDPTPFLERLDIPMFYAYGESDINIPTALSVATLDRLVAQSGKDIEYRIFPGAGHSLFGLRGIPNGGFVPGYLGLVTDWFAAQAGRSPQK